MIPVLESISIGILVFFLVYCVVDIARHPVKHLPKWAWILISLASVPAGGIVYLLVGRDHR